LLGVIEAKYPKHVPSLYRAVLDKRPDMDSWSLSRPSCGPSCRRRKS
jgi:hypothetical protein